MRIRITKETGGYKVGEVADLPPDVCASWIGAKLAEPEQRPEPETEVADRRKERAVTRARPKDTGKRRK